MHPRSVDADTLVDHHIDHIKGVIGAYTQNGSGWVIVGVRGIYMELTRMSH